MIVIIISVEIKEHMSDKLQCPSNASITVLSAVYSPTICEGCNYSTVFKCPINITNSIKNLCDKRNECVVKSNNDEYGEPCNGKTKYTSVIYSCHLESLVFIPEIVSKFTNTSFELYDEFVISFVILLNEEKPITFISVGNNIDVLTFKNSGSTIMLTLNDCFLEIETAEKWKSITILQSLENDSNTYNITAVIDGAVQYSNISALPMVFTDVFLVTFDNCLFNPNCSYGISIKNLSIYSKTQVLWSQWSEWSLCDTSCNITRNRSCSNNQWLDCSGNFNEVKPCYFYQASWAQWNSWMSFFDSNRSFKRTRECNTSITCDLCYGIHSELKEYSVLWTEWSDWSRNNDSYGSIIKTRECNFFKSRTFLMEKKTLLLKGKLIAKLKVLFKEQSVYFEIKPTTFNKSLVNKNVIRLATDTCYGCQILSVFVNQANGTLLICFDLNKTNFEIKTTPISIENWSSIKISQTFAGGNYVYSIKLNGEIIVNMINQDAREFSNVTVYVSDPFNDAQTGYIRNLTITNHNPATQCSNSISSSCESKRIECMMMCSGNYLEFGYIYIKHQFIPIKSSILGTLSVLKKEYIVSFNIKPIDKSIYTQGFKNILHITLGTDMSVYGDRNPGVWFLSDGSGKLRIHTALNSYYKFHFDTSFPLILNQWSNIKIYQSMHNCSYWFFVDLNGSNIYAIENSDARDFVSMKVYVSDPWYDAANCFISDLLIINADAVFWAPWNNLSSYNGSHGLINRTRECSFFNSTNLCYGIKSEVMKISGFWSQWNDWSRCNDSYGFMNRTKDCIVLNVKEWSYVKNFNTFEYSEIILMNEEILLSSPGNLITIIKRLSKQYSVSFEINPKSFQNPGYRNIIYLTSNNYGQQNPIFSFFLVESRILNFCFYNININITKYPCLTKTVYSDLSKWSLIKISQELLNEKYMYSIKLNGSNILNVENTDAIEFADVKVFVSGMHAWYKVHPTCIRSFKITNGNSVFLAQSSGGISGSCTSDTFSSEIMKNTTWCSNLNSQCYGNNLELMKCFTLWAPWSDWSICNDTYGFMNRSRRCNTSNPMDWCDGNNFDVMQCYAFWLQWSVWSNCNDTFGFMNRSRECNISHAINQCYGQNIDVTTCFTFWSQWSVWSNCNDTFGFMNRSRECNISHAMNQCYGQSTNVTECFILWTPWSDWSICNDTYGFMNRSRSCNASNPTDLCHGNNFNVIDCYAFWSPWNAWSSCNDTYEFMNKTRECNVSHAINQCYGPNISVTECFAKAYWTPWSNWSICNDTYGFMNRSRNCIISNPIDYCDGNNLDIMECYAFWTQWSVWSSCNTTYKLTNRTRECNISQAINHCHGQNIDVMECFEKWALWSECSVTCGIGTRSRVSLDSIYSKVMVENCAAISCPVNGMWGEWNYTSCSKTCGSGIVVYNRYCNKPRPSFNGYDCMGVNNYTKDCDENILCPVNGNWSVWTSWSLCSQPCGGGVMLRYRSCSNPTPRFGGLDCDGNIVDFKDCDWKNCIHVGLNLAVNFIDVDYTESYSILTSIHSTNLRNKIRDAIKKLYSTPAVNATFYVVIHSVKKP